MFALPGERDRGPRKFYASLISVGRYFNGASPLPCSGAVVVAGYLYWRLDDEIRRQVEKRLSDYYRDYDVRVGSARFDAEHGIAVGNLVLSQKSPDGTSQPVLSIEEMYLAGNVDGPAGHRPDAD